MSAEALLAWVSYRPDSRDDGANAARSARADAARDTALVGALRIDELIRHLAHISQAEIRASVPTPPAAEGGDDGDG